MRSLRLSMPVAAFAVLLAGCATGPSPTQVRLNNLDARVSKLERFVSNGSLVQLAQQQQSLQAQIRDLRGKVDQLRRSDRQLKKQQHDLYGDLSKRMTALENRAAQGPGPAGGAAGAAGAAGSPGSAAVGNASKLGALPGVTPDQQAAYDQAFNALKAGSYPVAVSGFEGFLKRYPSSPLAPNAEYWLGETHFVNQHYKRAERAFRSVFTRWPDSGKASDAMLDLSNVLLAQGKTRQAHEMLRRVIKQFPGTDAAKRAAQRLHK